jgi:hypothetical protein
MKAKTVLSPALSLVGLEPVNCRPHNEEYGPDSRPRPAELAGHPYCGRVKYHLTHRGPFKFDRSAFEGSPDVVKIAEWFGSGGSAHRLVIVSKRFRQVVNEAKWRGLDLEPIELFDASS